MTAKMHGQSAQTKSQKMHGRVPFLSLASKNIPTQALTLAGENQERNHLVIGRS
jgi:hypothetical protein